MFEIVKNNRLHVLGHNTASNITLVGEYLSPLRNKILSDGYIWNFTSIKPLNMFFDLKTDGPTTYKSLYNEIFANYSDLFSSWDDNRGYKQSFLHCIITGIVTGP